MSLPSEVLQNCLKPLQVTHLEVDTTQLDQPVERWTT
jgi:hypothetical protein